MNKEKYPADLAEYYAIQSSINPGWVKVVKNRNIIPDFLR
jgi:hypothetical protein